MDRIKNMLNEFAELIINEYQVKTDISKAKARNQKIAEAQQEFLDKLDNLLGVDGEKLRQIEQIFNQGLGDYNILNAGNIETQINGIRTKILNIYFGVIKGKFDHQHLKPYYARLNRDNYQSPILKDPRDMTLEGIYVAPNFSYHRSCLSDVNILPQHMTETVNVSDKPEAGYREKQFYNARSSFSVNDFMLKVLFDDVTLLAGNGLTQEKLKNTRLFFLLGQPGHGKTSFCRKLFYDLTREGSVIERPVFYVRLKDLPENLMDDPLKAIAEKVKDQLDEILGESQFAKKDLNHAILILDGLDELAMVSQLEPAVANHFCKRLQNIVAKPTYQRVKIIVTSRLHYIDLDEVNGEHDFTLMLRLNEFDLLQQEEWVSKFEKFYPGQFTLEHLREYNRSDPSQTKDIPKYKSLYDLLRLPILMYFIAQLNQDDLTETTNRAQIYEKVFDVILNRGYKDQGEVNLDSKQHIKQYRDFLRRIAFDMFATNDWFIRKEKIQLPEGITNNLHKLLANFYFSEFSKSQGSREITAIEFLHKSLQEYLTAEQIKTVIDRFSNEDYASGNLTNEIHLEGVKQLNSLLGGKRFTPEIGEYLVELLADMDADQRAMLSERFARFLPYLIKYDFVYQSPQKNNPRILVQSQAFCYNFWLIFNHLMPNKSYLDELDSTLVEAWLSYLKTIKVDGLSLQYQNFRGKDLEEVYLKHASLQCANFESVKAPRANFEKADLRDANLQNGIFTRANLIQANLRDADLRRASLADANLFEANFEDANLEEALFEDAYLPKVNLNKARAIRASFIRANLQEALLENVTLDEANLTAAYLWQANLDSAYLIQATLVRTDFTRAYLKSAKLIYTDLNQAILNGANLCGVRLDAAILHQTSLIGANLMGASLVETKLNHADFQGADLTDAFFQSCDLTTTNLAETTLTGASFEMVTLTQAQYDDLKSRGANLVDVNIV